MLSYVTIRAHLHVIIIIIITVFIQRLTDRRLVYNGITQVWEVLEWRQPAANRKVQPAGSLQPTPPLWCTCPSRSWSQLCCSVGRGTCVWTTYPRLLRGMPQSGIDRESRTLTIEPPRHTQGQSISMTLSYHCVLHGSICVCFRYRYSDTLILWFRSSTFHETLSVRVVHSIDADLSPRIRSRSATPLLRARSCGALIDVIIADDVIRQRTAN